MAASLQIRLFGGLDIRHEGMLLNNFVSSKAPALLAYLAVTGRSHQRETLATLLWGEMADADARNNLRQTLSNLRKLVGPYLHISRDAVEWLPQATFELDTAQFEDCLRASRAPDGQRMAWLHQAVGLYHGDFLAGFAVRDAPDFEEWLLAQRLRFRELALHSLHALASHQLKYGHFDLVIDYATRLLALDPWREEAHRQLILALARSGQRSAALGQFEACRRLLATELGVEPAPETTALYQRIRSAGQTPPHNLPSQPTPFIGRYDELAQLIEMLQDPDSRLITLVGTGGIGKTRLALQAASLAHRYGLFLDGVYFVALAGVEDITVLATILAEATSLPLTGAGEPITQIVNAIRGRELMLILDNYEQLVEQSDWLVQLLRLAPAVKVMVTSRERLRIHWERAFPVEGLANPSEEEGAEAAAVQLFAACARANQPDFAVTNANLPAIAQICQFVGGMPLALEIAAAASRYFSPAEIAAAIGANFEFLRSQFRDTPERQSSLRAVFDYSWQRLEPLLQKRFAALGIFRGSFTATAAQAVSSATMFELRALAENSLLQRQSDERFQFHETVRQYALLQLTQNPADLAERQRQYAAFYLQLAAQAEKEFHSEEQAAWLVRLDAEQGNFRAILEWSRTPANSAAYVQLCGSLWQYWYIRSRYREGWQWLAGSLPWLPAHAPQQQSKVLRGAGVMATQQGDYDRAVELLQQSLAIQRTHGSAKEIGLAINSLAVTLQAQGKYAAATDLYREGLTLQRTAGDQIGMAQTLQNLGAVAIDQALFGEAEQYSREGLELFRQLGLNWGIAYASINLGLALLHLGQPGHARHHIMESITLCLEIESLDSVAECLEALATIAADESNQHLSVQLLAQAERLRHEIGTPRQAGGEAENKRLLARLHQKLTPQQFAAAWQQGQSSSLGDILSDLPASGA